MPAKFKDYPLYVYDDPAIYNSFSGGINTNPNNEHLDTDELRDCLNMTYNSAGLIKRPGAKQLCTIVCSEELFNIQGVFIFTYNISYLIIAANGKLYYGLYNENIKTEISRLYIYSTYENDLNYKSPLDMTIGLDFYLKEIENQLHNGYICRSFFLDSKIADLSDKPVYDILSDIADGDAKENCILQQGNSYRYVSGTYTHSLNTPDTHLDLWVEATDENIVAYIDTLASYYNNHPNTTAILKTAVSGNGLLTYTISENVNAWSPQIYDFVKGEVRKYKNRKYICIKNHNYLKVSFANLGVPVQYKDSLVFQNKKPIEVATYDNRLYIATGTRFVEVYLLNNSLQAFICSPYQCSYNEIANIGNNILSPYPEYCVKSLYNQLNTSMSLVIPVKNTYGSYVLTPIATYAGDLTESDMAFKWEKFIDGSWCTIVSFKDNYTMAEQLVSFDLPTSALSNNALEWTPETNYREGQRAYLLDGEIYSLYRCLSSHTSPALFSPTAIDSEGETYILWEVIESKNVAVYRNVLIRHDYSKLTVTDADRFKYRVTMCELFTNAEPKDYSLYNHKDVYTKGDIVYVDEGTMFILYECVTSHIPNNIYLDRTEIIPSYVDDKGETIILWEQLSSVTNSNYILFEEKKLKLEETLCYEEKTKTFYTGTDIVPDKLNGGFGQASTSLYVDSEPHSLFETLHSCCSLHLDGNKLLLYNDAYNSGMWFKTKIDNPYYISVRGCLSFKTTKNENLIKVTAFSNNLIAFATTDNIGGSIHLVTGNGDDYDQDDYYSPYKRVTITESFTCNNAKTIQVCENYLFFKYFNTVYFIVSSELSNDVVTIYSANDNIKLESPYLTIPWEDNDCISEATEDYYALIWKEKYTITKQGLMLEHPAMKIKLYFKMAKTSGQKVYFPWLRDESKYFNVDHILYIKGKPVYLYNNILVSFDSQQYKDLDEPFKCLIHFRGVDTNYPKLLKVLSNIIVYYYHRPTSSMNLTLKAYNEAGNTILDSTNQKRTLQNLRTLKVGTKLDNNNVKTDYVTVASKVFNTTYKFPYLLIESVLEAETEDLFALSSMTYIYTSMDTPDSTMYDTYTKIIRKKEI